MSIGEHSESFAGKPIRNYEFGRGIPDLGRTAYRLSYADEADLPLVADDSARPADAGNPPAKPTLLGRLSGSLGLAGRRPQAARRPAASQRRLTPLDAYLREPNAADTTALVIGVWNVEKMSEGTYGDVVAQLATARDKLPRLTGVFLGDVTYEECEISWIVQTDVSPLLASYPRLEHLRTRGGNGLTFGDLSHKTLKSLTVESGGLGIDVLTQIAGAELPALESLEVWLGVESYGWNGTVADVLPLLRPGKFPRLRRLAVRDSEIADEIAEAICASGILGQIECLDLSLGTLTDKGGERLLNCQQVRNLRELDLHYHFLSDDMVRKLCTLGVKVDLSDQQDADEEDRYPSVTE